MPLPRRLLNTHTAQTPNITITLDGAAVPAVAGELLVETVTRALPGRNLAQVCYHAQLGPIQSCDTCMVEVDGKLVRASGTLAADGMNVAACSPRAGAPQREAFKT